MTSSSNLTDPVNKKVYSGQARPDDSTQNDSARAALATLNRGNDSTVASRSASTPADLPNDLEATMQGLALAVSLIGLSLMVSGYIFYLLMGARLMLPGLAVLPLTMLAHPLQEPLSQYAMSIGIVLLALLPAARVLLALWMYIRQRNLINVLAALVVFLELVWSMQAGG
ncbi:MAG: hypothetical protein FOGNACKC_04738 [Anaerolineae bacterium]|nr:hypothetical protein [Anaerolineae bacterium]